MGDIMANLTIMSTQDDVELGEKVSLLANVNGAKPGSRVLVVISGPNGEDWPGTVHVNAHGAGGCVSTNVVIPGASGTVTHVTLTGTGKSSAGDVFMPTSIVVRVHG
jgi:hypothetical protein